MAKSDKIDRPNSIYLFAQLTDPVGPCHREGLQAEVRRAARCDP